MNTVKVIHFIISVFIIFVGLSFLNITVDNEEIITITYKIFGFFTLLVGVFYLKRIAKFGKRLQFMT